MKNSAVKHETFKHTSAPPARRVVPEVKAESQPGNEPPAGEKPAKAEKPAAALGKLAALLFLFLLMGSNVTLATTTFWFTNDLQTTLTTMFYTNNTDGTYTFIQGTNTAYNTSNSISTAQAVQGVAIQGTNSTFARLVPFAVATGAGRTTSFIMSNTAVLAAGVPPFLGTAPGTNVVGGSGYTTIAPGTNAVSTQNYNTNLP